MAPMRGLSRAIMCVAATIIAIRFALHQRSVGESTTEPAKPTVRWRVATGGLAAPRALHDDAARGATGQAPAKSRV